MPAAAETGWRNFIGTTNAAKLNEFSGTNSRLRLVLRNSWKFKFMVFLRLIGFGTVMIGGFGFPNRLQGL